MSNAIKPRTATVVIYDGEDLARLAELDAAVERAKRADRIKALPLDNVVAQAERRVKTLENAFEGTVRLMVDADPLSTAKVELEQARADREAFAGVADVAISERDEFAALAEQHGVQVVLVARPRLEWRSLMREHGPRDDNDSDAVFGVNMETLPDVLLPASVDTTVSTITGDVTAFLDTLSDYDYYDRCFVTAFALNRGRAAADPTQRLLSPSSQIFAATSS